MFFFCFVYILIETLIAPLTNRKHNAKTDSGCIKEKDGNLLFERDEIAKRWPEYIKTLHSDETKFEPEEFENPESPKYSLVGLNV